MNPLDLDEHENLVNDLFLYFQSAYGNKFGNQLSNIEIARRTKQVWCDMLLDFESSDVEFAKMQMAKYHKEFPPTLFQFQALCDMSMKRRKLYGE